VTAPGCQEKEQVTATIMYSSPTGLSCIQRGRWLPPDRGVSGDEEESVMGVAKKAKHEAKAAKSKTKLEI
jgi:hypothetical protein